MRQITPIGLFLVPLLLLAVLGTPPVVTGKRPPSRSSGGRPPARVSGSSSRGRANAKPPPSSRRRTTIIEEEDVYDDEDGEADILGVVIEEEEDEDDFDEEEEYSVSRKKGPPARRAPGSSRTARDAAIHSSARGRKGGRYADDYEDEEVERIPPRGRPSKKGSVAAGRRGPPPGRGRPPPARGRVVPYTKAPAAPSAFTRGLDVIRNSMPDPEAVKNTALSSLKAARETTSSLSANIYREVKGLTSSELEQVMLKATRPDDTPVKGKHVERLVGVTYQISSRYDIYDAVLRKLWAKMAEKDWRTTIKALYVLHRFSGDGAPDHAPALKARLRELRRTRDPKRKDKYFNSKQLLAGDASPENIKFRAFLSRYAHYVLLRAQCFGGMFDEIAVLPKSDKKKAPKPITATCLRTEHLDAAAMLLKAGVACQLKDGEECENTAIAAERVASDLIGLTTAVAIALNRALKDDDLKGADPALIKKWCEFYKNDLLPQTKSMIKKTSPKLDAFGLFLPSRMGATVSQSTLEKGLGLEASEKSDTAEGEELASTESSKDEAPLEEGNEEETEIESKENVKEEASEGEKQADEEVVDEEAQFDEEYEYDEEEYYDDEEEA